MDVNYLHHREGVERMRADAALNTNARDAHLAMAAAYRTQIERRRSGLRRDVARGRG